MKINFQGKIVEVNVERTSVLGKFSGLMLKTSKTKNLLFEFGDKNSSIHSFFVFFNFLAVWLDEKNKVVDFSIVKPFKFIVKSKVLLI
ncbi:hypothetical protein HY450_01865 [Candidatus Pacearchaeota archaeon]|nr:hypothetical protein [Candidatus Pacearchaeota archaeon]